MSLAPPPRIPKLPRLTFRLLPPDEGTPTGEETAQLVPESEADFARRVHALAGSTQHVILLSGGDHPCSRHSIAALAPALILEARDRCCLLRSDRGEREFDANPFDLLDQLLESWWTDETGAPLPLIAGYVAYEAGRMFEALPTETEDILGLPDLWFCFPTRIFVHTKESGLSRECCVEWSDENGVLPALPPSHIPAAQNGTVEDERLRSQHPGEKAAATEHSGTAGYPHSNFDRSAYVAMVERIRQYIYEGDVYQVNLSQRFRFPSPESPFAFWLDLFAENPAPFYAWMEAGDHQVLSTSMERFFLLDGEHIETRPIKGTRPRGADEAEARRLAGELQQSDKDDAELSMIVDLERNDLGKICAPGSVRVAAHKIIERYANVQHLVSVVEGRLLPGIGIGEIFRALFPGGSITGCPKIRAMEIIDECERETRHVYTGAIGYIAASGRADFNIAIRSAILRDGVCHLSVGGGIVYDSDPHDEYVETLQKGQTFFRSAGFAGEAGRSGTAGSRETEHSDDAFP
ncbi:MAG: anthranilate synthase component I family protein [Bacteroidetes bacterium]|nr:anthranilate synthase component I family protein [Bacteroidota bacterium]